MISAFETQNACHVLLHENKFKCIFFPRSVFDLDCFILLR